MLHDRYDNPLSTTSVRARDGYVHALDLMLAGQAGAGKGFEDVTQKDPQFALGWVGVARAAQYSGNMPRVVEAMGQARALSGAVTPQEASHIAAMDLFLAGQADAALTAIRSHLLAFPRDAMVAQTSSSVFGLIGFSGRPGREAEQLAFLSGLLPHYGQDWWAISQYAFALCETGNLAEADRLIDVALAMKPDNAHGAHVRSHVSYEMGDTDAGRRYIAGWLQGYDPRGVMFTHLNWHEALWALEQGDIDEMWARVDAAVQPEAGSESPAINILTDTASILQRAAMAGVPVSPERWVSVSAFAKRAFPKTGNAFIDIHAALAHAMAGDEAAFCAILDHPAGPAGDLVPDLARGFHAVAQGDWGAVVPHMTAAMQDLARLGGSRAQRDLVEQTLLYALVQLGRQQEAQTIAALRRPLLASMVQ